MIKKYQLLTLALLVNLISFAQPLTEIQKLLASDGAAGDEFGQSVSISGDVAIVGARGDDDKGNLSGSAYIFYNDGSTWVQKAKLTASDGAANDGFGYSVCISGDVAIVGAWGDNDNGVSSGSAYIFEKPVDGWADMTQTAKLTAADGAREDYFGLSVSISGDVAIVGANGDDDNGNLSGSAYIFEKPGSAWTDMTQTAKLTAADGAEEDRFGISVSISGDVAIVGAREDDDNGINSGSAYIFEKPAGGWPDMMTHTAKLNHLNGGENDWFGGSVCISGDVAIVGTHAIGSGNASSAYIFEKSAGGWVDMTHTARLKNPTGFVGDLFGHAVGISADMAIVGAPIGNNISLYVKPDGGWTDIEPIAKLKPSDVALDVFFGVSVSISADLAIAGAVGDDDHGSYSGSAYIFGPDKPVCDDFQVNLLNSDGNPLAGGSLEYREGGGNGWQSANEIDDGVFCVDTDRSQVALRMTYGPQVLKVANVPTNTDYTFQMEEVTIKLREYGVLTDNGEVHYTSNGWHYIGVTGDNGTGVVKLDMLPNSYTFRMKYDGDIGLKQRTISSSYNMITFHVEDLKSAEISGADEFQLVAYPNPFNGNTTIAFSLEEAQEVNIAVYDQTGRLIEVLHVGIQPEGNHKISWDANNVNKGVYFVRLSTNGKVVHQNVVKM